MSGAATETLCAGCGATVTRFVDERTPEAIAYKDLSGSFFCLKVFAGDKDEMHFVELPPVAIKPDPQHKDSDLLAVLKEIRHQICLVPLNQITALEERIRSFAQAAISRAEGGKQ